MKTAADLIELHLIELSADLGSIREMNGHASASLARFTERRLAGRSLEELTLRELNQLLADWRAERAGHSNAAA